MIAITLLLLSSILVATGPAFAQGYQVWKGWYEVPGGGTTNATLAAASFNNNLYLFHKGDNLRVYSNSMVWANASWKWGNSWSEVSGGGTTNAALAAESFNNNLYLFLKGMNNHIYFNKMDASGKWGNSWSEVPGGGTTNAALAAEDFNNNLYLFHKGDNLRVYFNKMDASGKWGNSWSEVPGGDTTNAALAAESFNNNLYLFLKGMNSHIYFNKMDASGKWGNSWSEVPGGGTTSAALAAESFQSINWPNELFLFHKGDNNRIYYNAMDASGKWGNSWSEVPGGGTTSAALAAEDFGPNLFVFHKGDNTRIYYAWRYGIVG